MLFKREVEGFYDKGKDLENKMGLNGKTRNKRKNEKGKERY